MNTRIQAAPDWLQGAPPWRLNAQAIPAALRILALAPHPDDFEAIGVTMRLLRDNGNPIFVAVVTSGAGGVDDAFAPGAARRTRAALRAEEQRTSCRLFGLPEERLAFLRLREDDAGHILSPRQAARAFRRHLAAVQPDAVFLPAANDSNPEHRLVADIARNLLTRRPQPIVLFANEDPKTTAIRDDAFTAFDAAMAEWKAELLRCHRSQQERNLRTRRAGFDERILQMNRRAAERLALPESYAEVFEIACPAGGGG
jgi:LmbE family N-acetylglucosaminyl deacetylase